MSALTGPRTTTRTVDLCVCEEVDEELPFDLHVRLRLVLLAAALRRSEAPRRRWARLQKR